jgi:hypothetical protein
LQQQLQHSMLRMQGASFGLQPGAFGLQGVPDCAAVGEAMEAIRGTIAA